MKNKTKAITTTLIFLLFLCNHCMAGNTKTTVSQVSTFVTLNADVDFVVNGDDPFCDSGLVDIVNTTHAVLIIERIKPSKVISSLLQNHVKIKGEVARNNINCQVRLYGTHGSMILPYSNSDKPLTVFSEQNLKGDSCNAFGLENDGGYMVTMTDQKLNNRIRSFRLKRGYMVTFATGKSGYGYQRCFIANDADIEMTTLPQILDKKITSYRIFKWNTAGKKGLASSTDAHACDTLNVISCYGWDVGKDMNPDVECVANHLYEDYPSSSACGKATWTCHMKTNNEPRNGSDDNPQSLNTILANWQNLMRTGMRLCSPSSWDGSDYTDGSGFIKQFLDSIDARGWRCDLVDLHCYWLVDNFDKIGTMQSKYKRPIWISEWIWGASWNKNGAFESGKTDWDNEWAVKTICGKLNNMPYVERYFYWNSESKGKLYNNGSLTPAGQWYASQLTGMGYNKSYEKVPNLPRMRGGFSNFHVEQANGKAIITWHEYDGEYNQLMELLRKAPDGVWQAWKTITPDDGEADYQVEDEDSPEGTRYRLHIKSYSGRDYYSSEDMSPGETVETTDGLRYVGGNIILNNDFQMGLDHWVSGTGEPLAQPWFEVFPSGRTEGYFLQAFANHGKDRAGSIKTPFDIEPNQSYIIRVSSCNAGEYLKVDLRKKGESSDVNKATLMSDNDWSTKQAIFTSDTYDEALLSFRWLGGTAQLGTIELRRLFDNKDDAQADGALWTQRREALLKPYEEARNQQVVDSLLTVANAIRHMNFEGRDTLQQAIATSDRQQLQQSLASFLIMTESEIQPQSPSFNDTKGWETIIGTYTGGDQRAGTHEDKTCWNAWWGNVSADQQQQSMEIRQRIGGLPEGLYQLQCKASTQHYCLSDQHGYLYTSSEQSETPRLQRDYLDIPSTPSAWQTLTSLPVYVSGKTDTLTIGFVGSKKGAVDYAWRSYGKEDSDNNKGDLREGWWCATDFRLLYHPIFKFSVTPNQWGTICLPYAYQVPDDMLLYSIAGISDDYTQLCLEPVIQPEAGIPYIYTSTAANVVYYTQGEAVKMAGRGNNNLRGLFISLSQSPVGSYLLKDGVWQRCTEREKMADYSAFITKAEGMTVIEGWNGLTMPIVGVAEEQATNIGSVETSSPKPQISDLYDLLGRRLHQRPQHGLYIQNHRKVYVK